MSVRVFLSYTHESEVHKAQIRDLAQQLRTDGVNAVIDQFVNGTPMNGWPLWMQQQIEAADFVLVVCTTTYLRRFEGKEAPRKGLGATWEGAVLALQELYELGSMNNKYIPVVYTGDKMSVVPKALRRSTVFRLPNEYSSLLRLLTDQPLVKPVPVGSTKRLPALNSQANPTYYRADDQREDRTKSEGQESIKSTDLSILWVDDDGSERFLYEQLLLEDRGFDLDFATSTTAAAHCLAKKNYCLVIIDNVIPYLDGSVESIGGWGGCALFYWLRGESFPPEIPRTFSLANLQTFSARRENRVVPVIFATAYYDDVVMNAIHRISADVPFMRKPINSEELLRWVDVALKVNGDSLDSGGLSDAS